MDHQASVHAWFVARTRERTDSCCQRRFNRVLTHANCTANTESRLSVRQIGIAEFAGLENDGDVHTAHDEVNAN